MKGKINVFKKSLMSDVFSRNMKESERQVRIDGDIWYFWEDNNGVKFNKVNGSIALRNSKAPVYEGTIDEAVEYVKKTLQYGKDNKFI